MMEYNKKEKMYAYWLLSIEGIGNYSIAGLLAEYRSAEQIYRSPEKMLGKMLKEKQLEALKESRSTWDVEAEYDRLTMKGISLVVQGEKLYPKRLEKIPDAPYGIFYKGELPMEERLAVAVIGARECSEYGSYVAKELGKYLGTNGIQVISGMARGIDGISQQAALSVGGSTTAVLGCGVDICYPKQNSILYDKILEQGCVLSSYLPGTPPRPQYFPPRNRIVSGLADVIVVIEARNKSGTLITVDMALEQGKEVYVVPGRITDRLSDGCNSLLKQGAGVLLSPQDFLEEITGSFQRLESRNNEDVRTDKQGEIKGVPEDLLIVYKMLDFSPKPVEEIREGLTADISVAELNIKLMKLCLLGKAVQQSPGCFCVKK